MSTTSRRPSMEKVLGNRSPGKNAPNQPIHQKGWISKAGDQSRNHTSAQQ
jgi:hypothetical protein